MNALTSRGTDYVSRVVWLLVGVMKLQTPTSVPIFNAMFKERLSSFGLPSGVQRNRFRAQYLEHQKNPPPKAWRCIITPDSAEVAAAEREELVRKINTVAARLGLSVMTVNSSQAGAASSQNRNALGKVRKRCRQRTARYKSDEDADDDYSPATPGTKRLRSALAVTQAVEGNTSAASLAERARQAHVSGSCPDSFSHSMESAPQQRLRSPNILQPVNKVHWLASGLLFRCAYPLSTGER